MSNKSCYVLTPSFIFSFMLRNTSITLLEIFASHASHLCSV